MVQSKDRLKILPLAVFLVDQATRTLRQPSRLLFVPFLLPSYFPRLLTLVLAILPVWWPQGVRGKAFRLAVGNLVLLRYDRPEQGWHWMERVLSAGPRSTEEYFLGAVCLYQGLGRMREATAPALIDAYTRAIDMADVVKRLDTLEAKISGGRVA